MTSFIEHSTTASFSLFAIEWVNTKSSIWWTQQILRALGAKMALLPVAPLFLQKLQVHLKLQMRTILECDHSDVWMTSFIEHSTTASLSLQLNEWIWNLQHILIYKRWTRQIIRALGAKMAVLPVAPIVSSEAASTSEITNANYSWMWLQRRVNDKFHWT